MFNLPGKYNKPKYVYVLCMYPNTCLQSMQSKNLKAKYTKNRPTDNYNGRI